MWSRLNVKSAVERLGNVVAPPMDDEHYEEDEDINSQEGYDSYEEEVGGDEEDDHRDGPFGFVSMLTRALDKDRRPNDVDQSENEVVIDYGQHRTEFHNDLQRAQESSSALLEDERSRWSSDGLVPILDQLAAAPMAPSRTVSERLDLSDVMEKEESPPPPPPPESPPPDSTGRSSEEGDERMEEVLLVPPPPPTEQDDELLETQLDSGPTAELDQSFRRQAPLPVPSEVSTMTTTSVQSDLSDFHFVDRSKSEDRFRPTKTDLRSPRSPTRTMRKTPQSTIPEASESDTVSHDSHSPSATPKPPHRAGDSQNLQRMVVNGDEKVPPKCLTRRNNFPRPDATWNSPTDSEPSGQQSAPKELIDGTSLSLESTIPETSDKEEEYALEQAADLSPRVPSRALSNLPNHDKSETNKVLPRDSHGEIVTEKSKLVQPRLEEECSPVAEKNWLASGAGEISWRSSSVSPRSETLRQSSGVSGSMEVSSSSRSTILMHLAVDNSDRPESPAKVIEAVADSKELEVEPNTKSTTSRTDTVNSARLQELEKHCQMLQEKLNQAENHIIELQQDAARRLEAEDQKQELLMQHFHEKEARLLEASNEEHQIELEALRNDFQRQILKLQQDTSDERAMWESERDNLELQLRESSEKGRHEQKRLQKEHAGELEQIQHRQERALRMTEEKLAQTMALLDEREEQVKNLKAMLRDMQSQVNEHQEGAVEAEEEMDELHSENEALRHHVETVEAQCTELRAKIAALQAESDKVSVLKMEQRILREELERERTKNHSMTQSAENNTAHLETERDRALADVQNLKQQLAAMIADLDVARADTLRVMTANTNLQAALEAFQTEREAELAMLEEQKTAAEEATAAAHAAALSATHGVHEAQIRELQRAFECERVSHNDDMKRMEAKLESFRAENVHMRRSLDEAIHRLQTNQEDVIDREFMKNILLDWLTKSHEKERHQILEVMAKMLHFSEEEKAKVHIGAGGSLLKVVENLAAPPPPSRASVENIQGDNVREKWVNFLLAETED